MRSQLTGEDQKEVQQALVALEAVTLLRGVLEKRVSKAVLTLLAALVPPEQESKNVARAYREAFYELATAANEDSHLAILPDTWQAYLVNHILDDVNPWSTQAERTGGAGVSPTLIEQAKRDLRALQQVFELSAQTILQWTLDASDASLPGLASAWEPWIDLTALNGTKETPSARATLCQQMAKCADWGELVAPLTRYWSRFGTGKIARHHVMRWDGRSSTLQGVRYFDTIHLANLIGYEREQHILSTNIERFLAGLPAHDVVLYGAPGTGKSSTVKALANTYAEQGLRLIEVYKEDLRDLSTIVAQLRGRAPHFLLFIDDLSFEEHETEYKALKVLLEGTAEARPSNLLIHATTNRLNLIRENFSDRGKPTEDAHWRDTMDEKGSLVARFGLRVTFISPDQQLYLTIARELAHQRGIHLEDEELSKRALTWERQHAGRSGRTARQFVDDLQAELASGRPNEAGGW
jgi:uncharacterized protein